MWQGIARQLSDALGQNYCIQEHRPLSTKLDERNYVISDGHRPYFVKIAPDARLEQFACEQRELQALRLHDRVRLPIPCCYGIAESHSFLIMEYLTLHEGETAHWFSLGAALARLHRCEEQAMYGWDEDNYLGMTVQPNRWHKQWASFFAEQRIGWQLQLLKEKGYLAPELDIDGIVDTVQRLLWHHQPKASPLHGDLWRGNCGFADGNGVIFDPACYFGDRETDLAMTELFGRFPDAFYQGYGSIWPLEPGYAQRRELYNLYHRLNQYNQFGESYRQQAMTALELILAN